MKHLGPYLMNENSQRRLLIGAQSALAIAVWLALAYGSSDLAALIVLALPVSLIAFEVGTGRSTVGNRGEQALQGQVVAEARVAVDRAAMLRWLSPQAVLLLGQCGLEVGEGHSLARYMAPADAVRLTGLLRDYPSGENELVCALCPELVPGNSRQMRVEVIERDSGRDQYLLRLKLLQNASDFEKPLNESAQYFRSLFEWHPDAVYAIDRKGHFVLANDTVRTFTGYSRQVLFSETFDHMIPEEDRERVRERFMLALEGEAQHYETWVLKADGGRYLADVTNVPIFIDGEITGVFGIARDVTDAYRAREQLATSERRYRALFESVGVGVFVLDADDRILSCNPTAAQLLHQAPEGLVSSSLKTFFDVERALQVHGKVSKLAAPDHPPVYIEVESGPLVASGESSPDEEGQHYVFMRDVTQRYLAEKEHRLLRACVANIDDVIMITESHPLEAPGPRILFVNESVERVTGYPREALLGLSPRVLQGPDTDRAVTARIRQALERCEPVSEVLRNYTSTGEAFWNQLDIVPLSFEEEGETLFCSVQRDITAQREWERDMRRLNAALEEAREEERWRIARDLHDELGQTLSAIKLDLGRIRRAHQGEDKTELLDSANNAAAQAIAQVRSIATQLRPSLLDDLGFVAAARWFLGQAERRLEIPVIWHGPEADGDLPSPLATALYRVLQEALTNIGRHARAERVDVSFREAAGLVRLSIRDDGAGFDPEAKPVSGSGLGLVGMRERIEGLRGHFQILSAPGEGCVVNVELPLGERPDDIGRTGG